MPLRSQPLLSISQFAKLSNLPRKTLIYYHGVGLLEPEIINEKGYRFYSFHQLDIVYAIHALKKTGISLAEIKDYLDKRSPETLVTLFEKQQEEIGEEIRQLQTLQDMMRQRIAITKQGAGAKDGVLTLVECPREWLYISKPINQDGMNSWWEAALDFHTSLAGSGLEVSGATGTVIAKELLQKEMFQQASHIYCKAGKKKLKGKRVEKPAGLYLVGIAGGKEWVHGTLYHKMFAAIKEQGLEICGNGYEEYLLDELSVQKEDDYRTRISIQVVRKG